VGASEVVVELQVDLEEAVVAGTAWGVRLSGTFDPLALAMILPACVLIHATANVVNDIFDDRFGADGANRTYIHPYSGGSRFLQNGVMTAAGLARLAGALFTAAVAIGLVLAWFKGLEVLAFGVAGIALGYAYSAPPLRLSARGLGEITVAAAFGPLPIAAAAWAQGAPPERLLSFPSLMISTAAGLWVAAILIVNEAPDAEADGRSGKRTLAVRCGPLATALLYVAVHAAAFAALAGAVWVGAFAWPLLIAPAVFMVFAAISARAIAGNDPGAGALLRAIRSTLAIHGLGLVWLTLWALLAPLS